MSSKTKRFMQDRFIYHLLNGLNTPRSLTVWLLYSSGEHQQLVDLEFNPKDYNSISDARDALLATKLLSKATFLKLQRSPKNVAMEGFFAAEKACKETNQRIRKGFFTNPLTQSILLRMSYVISNILGNFDAEEFVSSCNFGPGATTLLPRRIATHPNKFDFENRITREAYEFVTPWINEAYPLWRVDLKVQGWSKIVTVPKNAKTDRTIAIEPGLNLWFQKGLGSMLRKRLLGIGIDLNNQSYNQKKSRIGSKFNTLATVDFSAASDTIAKELVRELLPGSWLSLFELFRSSFGKFEGEVIHFEKFSSMGNGFTFELETLIFYALAVACCDAVGIGHKDVSVYGDDVILPSIVFDLYSSVASDIGFTINKKKSYSSSYYRESCGAHYWNGIDIKPIFLKEPLDGKDTILLAVNNIRRLAHRRNSYGCDRRLLRCWQYAVGHLTGFPRISDGYGDLGVIENIDHPSVTVTKAPHGYEGYFVRVYAPVAYSIYGESKGLLLAKLRAMGISLEPCEPRVSDMTSDGNQIPLPGRTRQARIRLLVPRWYDLGPWI